MKEVYIKYITYRNLGALAPVVIKDGEGRKLDRIYTGQTVCVHTDSPILKVRSYILSSQIELSNCGDVVYCIIYVKFRNKPFLKQLDLTLSNYLTIAVVDKEKFKEFSEITYQDKDVYGTVNLYFKIIYLVMSLFLLYVALFVLKGGNSQDLIFLIGLGNLVGSIITTFRKKVLVQNEQFKLFVNGTLGILAGIILVLSDNTIGGLACMLCFFWLIYSSYNLKFLQS